MKEFLGYVVTQKLNLNHYPFERGADHSIGAVKNGSNAWSPEPLSFFESNETFLASYKEVVYSLLEPPSIEQIYKIC